MAITQHTEMTTAGLSTYMSGDALGGQTKSELETIVIVILDRLAEVEAEMRALKFAKPWHSENL